MSTFSTHNISGYSTAKALPDGMTLDNTVIGSITPKAGTFTTLTAESLVLSEPERIDVSASVIAASVGGQTDATQLTAQYNLITTATLDFSSVKLATAAAGLVQIVKNSTNKIVAVFPGTSDSINELSANQAIYLAPGAEVRFVAIDGTTWETRTSLNVSSPSSAKGSFVVKASDNADNYTTTVTNAEQSASRIYSIPDAGADSEFLMAKGDSNIEGKKTFTDFFYVGTDDSVTAAAGGGQESATGLTKAVNVITICASDRDSVKLTNAIQGLSQVVINATSQFVEVYPPIGESIDDLSSNQPISLAANSLLTFTSGTTGTWSSAGIVKKDGSYTTGTTSTVFAAGELTGASFVIYNNTKSSPGSVATRTAAEMFLDDPYARVGGSYILRIINNQGTGDLTITAGTGVTLTGSGVSATNKFRDYLVTYTSTTTLTIQSIGVGSDT